MTISISFVFWFALVQPVSGFRSSVRIKIIPQYGNAFCSYSPRQLHMSRKYGSGSNRNNDENVNNSDMEMEEENRERSVKEQLEKSLSNSRAKEEYQRLLSDPQAPFDREGAISSLPFIPSMESSSGSEDEEKKAEEIEVMQRRAILQQDFKKAQQLREELYRVHVDDCGYVLQVNAAFYKAINECNYDTMQKLWLPTEEIQCIHPSTVPLLGYDTVLSSWKDVFELTTTYNMNNALIVVEPTNIKLLSLKGSTAVLICEEQIYRTTLQRGVGRKRDLVHKLHSTNVFRKVDNQWFIVHHHGSWHYDDKQNQQQRRDLLKKQPQLPVRRNPRGEIIPPPTIAVDTIHKIYFGPTTSSSTTKGGRNNDLSKFLMGGTNNGFGQGGTDGSKNIRIFRGSLSDLLKGGMLEAFTSNGKDSEDDEEEDLEEGDDEEEDFSASISGSKGTVVNGVTWVNANNEDDVAEEDPMDDDDESADEDEEVEEEYLRKVLQLRRRGRWEGGKYIPRRKKNNNVSLDTSSKQYNLSGNNSKSSAVVYKDEIRQNCISALRKLCHQVRCFLTLVIIKIQQFDPSNSLPIF